MKYLTETQTIYQGIKYQQELTRNTRKQLFKDQLNNLFVCLLLNGTSALFRTLVPRIVEIEHTNHVKNDLK